MVPKGPQNSFNLLIGDYLRVTTDRPAVSGRGADEGFARIERIEHLAEDLAREIFTRESVDFGPVPVVWCHGTPGPLVLRGGDVHVLDHANPGRVRHDEAHPWWPPAGKVLLRGAVAAGHEPYRWRREPIPWTGQVTWADADWPPRAPYRATGFTKSAAALLVGDYLRIHRDRWPECDQDVDEGFARVEHLRLLNPELTQQLFVDLVWGGTVVVASVYGLPGVLMLRGEDTVEVQAVPNPERAAWEARNRWSGQPSMVFIDSHAPTDAERQAAEAIDAACRPQADEAGWYPSRFSDPFQRRLALESRYGLRTVPLSALPWPHGQSNCRMGRIADTYKAVVADEQTAHAAAFLSAEGRETMSSCSYHQPDWPRLVRILTEILDTANGQDPQPQRHPDYVLLSAEDKQWLQTLLIDPIEWDDRDQMLTNGQHRLCALRAAEVQHCPVRGRYLPDTTHSAAVPAADHARAAIRVSWQDYAAARRWPRWAGTLADKLPSAIQMRLLARGRRVRRSPFL
ncbi:hypothetical protein ACFFS4_44405 [Kutzneria kofuensis]|uniref:Uncharacterized protein n=1 Tax=Kutzneria kofuensis TaxID=103725 RepID=A0A7W9KFY3_9PSEU|nr:hypothetical protein [Kutzneria kofuensis]MBB5891868.1 hypothetical protein [Kutzneria kofuensis]